jgi:hypothetical protein
VIATLRAFECLSLRLRGLPHRFLLLLVVLDHVFLRFACCLSVRTALGIPLSVSMRVQRNRGHQYQNDNQLFHLNSKGEREDCTGCPASSKPKLDGHDVFNDDPVWLLLALTMAF